MDIPITRLLAAAGTRALPVVDGITDDRFAEPTPCADYTVADLANHLYQVVVNFQVLAAKGDVDWTVPADYLHGDWRKQFAAEVDNLIAAWAAPDSEEGVSPGWGIPSRTVGHMALLDLTLHAWDLARATGQSYEPAPEAVAEIAAFIDAMAPMARENKVFGPEFPVPADAPAFVRILGAAGRNPDWKP